MSALHYIRNSGSGSEDLSRTHFDTCVRAPQDWKDEVYAAARTIINTTTKPIWICLSGGIKSEIVARAFFDQGINFSALTLEHEGGTNRHEVDRATKWCRERGIDHKVVSINMETFLSTEVDAYAERYVAIHPFRYLQIKLMELVEAIGGYAVLGVDEATYLADLEKPRITRADVYLQLTTGNMAPLEWCKDGGVAHEPYFFFGTPELCLAYMRLPLVSFVLDHPETVFRHERNTLMFRNLVFQSVWADIEPRYKLTGFETMIPSLQTAIRRLQERFGEKHIEYRLPVKEMERQLAEGVTEGPRYE